MIGRLRDLSLSTTPLKASDFRTNTHSLLRSITQGLAASRLKAAHAAPTTSKLQYLPALLSGCCTTLHPQPVNFSTFRPYFPAARAAAAPARAPVDVAASCDAAAAMETVAEKSAGAVLQPRYSLQLDQLRCTLTMSGSGIGGVGSTTLHAPEAPCGAWQSFRCRHAAKCSA